MNIRKKDLKEALNENQYAIEIYKDKTTGDIVYRSPKGVVKKIADADGIAALEAIVSNLNDGTITTEDLTLTGSLILTDGTVGDLAIKVGADMNNGLYGVSDTQLGVAVEGALVAGFDVSGVFTSNISEQVGGVGVTVDGVLLKDGGVVLTGTLIANGTTTSSGAGAVAITGTIHEITTTGIGNPLTLVNGVEGQILHVVYAAETAGADTAILTPTNLAGVDATITFNNVGDTVTLLFTAGNWFGVGVKGAVFA